ncbi:MAG: Fic family protein [Eggerthellaceae bacterium]
MEYKELSRVSYADSSNDFEATLEREYRMRFEAASTFRLGFDTPEGELFIAVPREMSLLTEKILRTERRISSMLQSMPASASSAVLRGFVLDEVVSTNAIEDICSTREQVKKALEVAPDAPAPAKRFRELATLYLDIINGSAVIPSTPEDVRKLYDEVTCGEIPSDKMPDGRLFRAQGVDIVQGGYKVVHSGLEPESRIIEAIEKMLKIAASDEIPALYGGLAVHYLFGYIHPFYDGNGRTGRYLLSLMLNETLSSATALSLSRTIAENRDLYYRAFKTTERTMNKGELTFFIYSMLELVREAQVRLETALLKNIGTLREFEVRMEVISEKEGLKEQGLGIVYMLMQHEAFGLLSDAPLEEIAAYLGLKPQMTRRHIVSLESKGIVRKVGLRNPVTFALTDAFVESYELPLRGSERKG